MDQRARFECKERIALVPIQGVLVHRIGGVLPGERVLEFGGDHGDAVARLSSTVVAVFGPSSASSAAHFACWLSVKKPVTSSGKSASAAS